MKLDKRFAVPLLGVVIVAAAALPLVTGNLYHLYLASTALIWVTLALGLQLIFGYGGMLSVAHGALFGLGAYASAVLNVRYGYPVWISAPIAIAIVALASLVIGFVAVRAAGMSFAVITLAFGAILHEIFLNWTSLTRGPLGIAGIGAPDTIRLPGSQIDFLSRSNMYLLVVLVVLLAYLLFVKIVSSEFGLALLCTREDDTLASAYGIPVRAVRRIAFVLSGVFAGLAGTLFAHYFQFIAPESFTFLAAFQAIVMVVVGGAGTLLGALVGGLLLSLLPELLRSVESYQAVVYGVILFLFIRFLPEGIVGRLRRGRQAKSLAAASEIELSPPTLRQEAVR